MHRKFKRRLDFFQAFEKLYQFAFFIEFHRLRRVIYIAVQPAGNHIAGIIVKIFASRRAIRKITVYGQRQRFYRVEPGASEFIQNINGPQVRVACVAEFFGPYYIISFRYFFEVRRNDLEFEIGVLSFAFIG